jgi:hypothetical protein
MARDPNVELLERIYADWARGDYRRDVHLRGIGSESRVPIDALGANIVCIRHGKLLYRLFRNIGPASPDT